MNHFDPHYFIFQLPLYREIEIDKANSDSFIQLMRFNGSIDEYSPVLKENTTYKIDNRPSNDISAGYDHYVSLYKGFRKFELICTRNGNRMVIYLRVFETKKDVFFVEKIGQFPSIADLEIAKIKEYSIILKNDKLKEISKAVGLAAHGVGIGSFVYLRRVFEFLIEEAHSIAKEDEGWDESKYLAHRISDKIELLSHHLPTFLVENKGLYGILSKGIHELTEDECLSYFEIVKVGIEFILDEKLEKALKEKKIAEAKRRIQETTKDLK
ncbi:MAG: hypothetical protein ABI367_06760 [Mucilaginibacter sp.]